MVNTPGKQLFTEQVDTALSSTVKKIAGKHDRFVTDVFGEAYADNDNRTYTWLEAWRDKVANLWYIDHYTRVPDVMGEMVHKKKISSIGICFFDALHHCSTFHHMEEEKGRIVFPADEGISATLPNYRQAATAAGQVIDGDGIAQPCADGRILTDGFFSRESLAIALTSADMNALSAKPAPQHDLVNVLFQDIDITHQTGTALAHTNQIQHVMQKRALYEVFKKAAETGDQLMSVMNDVINHEFNTGYFSDRIETRTFTYAVSIATVGVVPLINYALKRTKYNPDGSYQKAMTAFSKAIAALPDSAEKAGLESFEAVAQSTFHLERAAAHYVACIKNQTTIPKISLGLPDLELGAKIAGKSDIDISSLKTLFIDGGIERKQFLKKLNDVWDPYLGGLRLNKPWNIIYEKARQLALNPDTHISPRVAVWAGLSAGEVPDQDELKNKWPMRTPPGPALRVNLHEKIKALEANLGLKP